MPILPNGGYLSLLRILLEGSTLFCCQPYLWVVMHSIDGLQVDTSLQEQFKADGADQVAIAKAAGLAIASEDWTTDR